MALDDDTRRPGSRADSAVAVRPEEVLVEQPFPAVEVDEAGERHRLLGDLQASGDLSLQSPVEEVALTVPTTDDPSLPVLTFRMWTLGTLSCIVLSILNQFFCFRTEPLIVSSVSAQIAVLPLGRLMAATLPTKMFRIPFSTRQFTLNPGPFNMKEHVLITIFANAGAGSVYAIYIVTSVKVFYKKQLDFFASLVVVVTTQILGFGWAGLFRRHLVEPATMWWPANLVQVSLFRALHEHDERPRWGFTRNQFFLMVLTCSFAYYVLPGYMFPMLTSLSWICWIFPRSVVAQQIGSGLSGLGLGAIGIDWSTISSYLGSPLATPWFAVANVMAGFLSVMYFLTPLVYYVFDVYGARAFPIFSEGLFTSTGQNYNITEIINDNFQLDIDAYNRYGRLHLSTFFVFSYGRAFAALTATISHVLLFHGVEILELSRAAFRDKKIDIHTRLMKHYKEVPQSWFLWLLFVVGIVSMTVCETYNDQLQLRWWGVLLACAIAFLFTLPIGIITATTNQKLGLNVITEYIIGYLYPGYPVACACFKAIGYVSISQALTFLQDFKLGHYMKIPPRTMFVVQLVGSVISAVAYLGTAWWMIEAIPNICDESVLPLNSPWTCPSDHIFFDASVIWGLIGPRRIFGNLGQYRAMNWFFLLGALGPVVVWIMHKVFPKQAWIKLINFPVILGVTGILPPATATNFTSWCMMGFLFSFVIFRYRKAWWQRHNYLLSGGLDAGLAFMAVLLYLFLGLENISLNWWGENLDGCPLATCPTAPGIMIQGCPVVEPNMNRMYTSS